MKAGLKKRGSPCSRKRVSNLMRREKIQARRKKKWKRTTQLSKKVVEIAAKAGILLSMSDKGHYYDNAVAESFFHTLKTEEVHLSYYRTREEARLAIFEYVEVFYNRQRLHSTLGYRSPLEYEKSCKITLPPMTKIRGLRRDFVHNVFPGMPFYPLRVTSFKK